MGKLLLSLIVLLSVLANSSAQKRGLSSISIHELKTHMLFLASDELEGRNTGEHGLKVAARYLGVQAGAMGLNEVDGLDGYFQHFALEESSYEKENCSMSVLLNDSLIKSSKDAFFVMPAPSVPVLELEGEVAFAGYGISDPENSYDDLEGLDLEGKIVLIMNRAPMNEEGTQMHFDHNKWNQMQNMQYKLPAILAKGPRAVLVLMDPKSGMNSVTDLGASVENYLGRSRKMAGDKVEGPAGGPVAILAHRSVADAILGTCGKDLATLQKQIDSEIKPASFPVENVKLQMKLKMQHEELSLVNVFGLIEGSDPRLKDEVVLYVAHYDHVGVDGKGGVFNGADDNASGSVALLEIAQAFLAEKKMPARSVGFAWVSAEEIGLYGSRYLANNSPLEEARIVSVVNLDMVARTKTPEDVASERHGLTIQGGDSIKIIGGFQSKVLMDINKRTLEEMDMAGNYQYNKLDDPNQYFYRSDHISFARKDIPVLFYSTGTHKDYHLTGDVEEALDYDKFLKMTRFSFKLGYNVASHKGAIAVDKPMSTW